MPDTGSEVKYEVTRFYLDSHNTIRSSLHGNIYKYTVLKEKRDFYVPPKFHHVRSKGLFLFPNYLTIVGFLYNSVHLELTNNVLMTLLNED